jgi:Domain of unknown function (DUF4157)
VDAVIARQRLAAPSAERSRAYGNRDARRVVQSKLRVTPAGDRHEREADRLAATITGGSASSTPAHAHRPWAEHGPVDRALHQDIQRARGRGLPLPAYVRAPAERALGEDFSHVRLHTGSEADRLSRSLNARAFTTGRDVFLRRGQASLTSPAGRELIAHELTHVAQQAHSGTGEGVIQRTLYQIGPDEIFDDVLGVTVTRDPANQHTFLDDAGTRYEIGKDISGNPTLVLTGFTMPVAPVGWTLAGTQGFTPAPAFSAPPVEEYWQSPGGTTTYSHSPGRTAYEPGVPQGTYATSSNRDAAGYVNPKQFHPNMLPLWEKAVHPAGSMPPTATTDALKIAHFQDPNTQFEVKTGFTTTKIITGYQQPGKTKSAVVLGHSASASTLFSTGAHGKAAGHTVPRLTNYQYNQTLAPYESLEDYIWSSKSAKFDPPYEKPRPDRGSHRTYWDPKDPKHTGGPWPSYGKVHKPTMTAYISGKLAGVPAANRDADYVAAKIKLNRLKKSYSRTRARQLLSMIKTKGW